MLLAPAVQPGPLFEGLYERNQPGPLNGLAMLVVDAWSRVYADTPANTVLAANMLPRLAVAREQCLFGVIDAFQNLVPRDMFLGNPRTIPGWSERIQQNTASIGDLGIPVLVAQGLADGVVDPAVTADYVRQQCAAGNRIQFVTYAGVDHFGVAERSVTDQIRWLQAIRNGETPTTC
jgi:pimeloyl-ACP methyl ester carboxylesterase